MSVSTQHTKTLNFLERSFHAFSILSGPILSSSWATLSNYGGTLLGTPHTWPVSAVFSPA